MLNLPILPILIILPLIGMAFVILSPESDEFARESKKSAIWTSSSTFLLSLYLPLNFDKSIPHFQFVNTFSWFNSENLRFSLGVDGLSMPFVILSTVLILIALLKIFLPPEILSLMPPSIDFRIEGTPGKQKTFSTINPGAALEGLKINLALFGILAIFFLPLLKFDTP